MRFRFFDVRLGLLLFLVSAVVRLGGGAYGADLTSPTSPATMSAPVASSAPPAQPSITPEARGLLDRVEKRFAEVRAMEVRFDQVRRQPDFDEETRSGGHLWVQLPDKLRCEYDKPDPATVLFVGDAFYQYTPSLKQVDMTRFGSQEEARRHLRTMLLGFGLSTAEVLESYGVAMASGGLASGVEGLPGLVFTPLQSEVAKTFSEFDVWFDPSGLTPRKVRIVEVGGDVVTLTVESLEMDKAIDPERFTASFPKDVEVVDHSSVGVPATVETGKARE